MKAAWISRAGIALGVLVAVGLLYVLIAPPLDGNADMHRKMQTKASLEVVGRSLDEWVVQHGRAPNNQEALSVLELRESPVRDGWGHPLIYQAIPGRDGRKFQLRSAGPNGQDDGGEGDDIVFPTR
jgi:Type II secretion system (T2SS), protein G